MNSRLFTTLIFIAACAISTGASAHIGTDVGVHSEIGFLDGLLHPLTGLDHLAAMLAVGFWSALTARRLWTTPLAFAAILLLGASLGPAGIELPAVEPMIAASLLVLGLLVALRARLPALLAAALVGVFAIFHGVAHGTELAGAPHIWAPLLGMLATTVALHATGLGLGLALRRRGHWASRMAGVAVTVFGSVLLLQMV
ncbi:HupE/UreJ family protein [Rhodoferax ferrireducens]|uniref:HupE/UreJ family protein n=1 Tax=Rhodoferax ferrireducens TaxID=192843 RepID=UPI000E0D5692|nr:HupE/UreJ family protein [Rhodoferax ferrireducens]